MQRSFFKFVIIAIAVFLPLAGFAAGNLIPCGQTINGEIPHPCTFSDAITLINNFVDFIFKKVAMPLAAIVFAYAGFQLLFSGGKVEAKQKAINTFINVGWGLILIAGSWVIIHTISNVLGWTDSSWIGF